MRGRLWELLRLFAKLGTISFGGPAAHLALLEDEAVHRRQWLSREQFLDLLGATYLIPGPNALEMVAHVGYLRAGVLGSLAAAAAFTLPAAMITVGLAWAYAAYGALPEVEPLLRGIKPAVLVIIFVAVYRLGRTALWKWQGSLIGLSVAAAALGGVNEILALLAGALAGAMLLRLTERGAALPPGAPLAACSAWLASQSAAGHAAAPVAAASAAAAGTAAAVALGPLALFFLKVGAVLYGSGYVLVAYLRGGLVGQYGFTEQQLVDAVGAGQITPGPLITTATFVGFLLAGPWGAAVATVAIILPGLILVILTSPWISRLREWRWSARFLDAVNAASVGLTAAVMLVLARGTLTDWRSWLIVSAAGLAVLCWRPPLALLVLGGGLAGWLLW